MHVCMYVCMYACMHVCINIIQIMNGYECNGTDIFMR